MPVAGGIVVPVFVVDMEDPKLLMVDVLLLIDGAPVVLDVLLLGLLLEVSEKRIDHKAAGMLGMRGTKTIEA